ncbi:Acetyltransferase YpeA [Frondihabitans sp. 762G35]|uniref:GNAT family acetyltransferase n=1 Tax=Frondihabitans sp. 762G35 TaxID=1446794 RepID=UPI000D21A294|nr:GNAT family acetyltransferase [Frondihabitans sp. 762G35]ARC58119.1 Acetyltransferase YpeA [Frondihabitans sp. 762G35]
MPIRPFRPADTEPVVALWEACGLTRPWNDPRKDIARKLGVQPELFLVAVDEGDDDAPIATAMAGYDGHRGWIYYVAVTPSRQGERLGSLLVARVEELLLALGCPKVNLQVREGNSAVEAFYERHGYSRDGAVGLGKRLIAD